MGCISSNEQNKKREHHIGCIGMQNSGKSSLIYYIKNQSMKKDCKPTEEIEQTSIKIQNRQDSFLIKEEPKFKNFQQMTVHAWIVVLDITQQYKEQDLQEFFCQQKKNPILIYINKKEKDSGIKINDWKQQINKILIPGLNVHIEPSCNNGEGVNEGFNWLKSQLNIEAILPEKKNEDKK